eukprot:gnl/MRDRNA2_/MRDRNA2_87274_c0_seq1.p1 gnl/MRDRNA2_/MRDRNA2_87274_c0~~gnl/MRDRNA2_/MRDRNA2_87274_c0_seq1.p1  ORF type:complete len:318 (-),score=34.38 gnl/MRDRNA2_/MRDRNA2_87274_c0_seq1:553-1506(-)
MVTPVWSTTFVFACAVMIGSCLVAFDSFLIKNVWRPLGYYLCGVPWARFVPDKYPVVEKKVPVWLYSGLLHMLEIVGCWYYACKWTWWRDLETWPKDTLLPLYPMSPEATAERDFIASFYMWYLGYVCFTFVRDVFLKEDRTGGNWMFSLHHAVTLFLTLVSFHFGEWRAGLITRMCLGVGEVTLYWGKAYSARQQCGHGSRPLLAFIFFVNFLVWGAMRCIWYGYLCYSLSIMYMREKTNWSTELFAACTLELIGCWILWVLQVVWTPFILASGYKFLSTGHMSDGVHRDGSEHLKEKEGKKGGKLDEKAEEKKVA